MIQAQGMALKVQEKLVTRLFLSTKLQQNLKILSYNAHDLGEVVQEFAQENPFVELKYTKKELQNLDWIQSEDTENLIDHLLSQVRMSDWSDKEKKVVTFLIYNLESDGYLRAELESLKSRSIFSLAELKAGREKLHRLDPLGIGAKDLTECLLIQAKNKVNFNKLALSLLEHEELEKIADPNRWNELSFKREEILLALKSIQTLNPMPASEYEVGEQAQYLIPDIKFYFDNDELMITTSSSNLPEIIFNKENFSKLKDNSENKDKKYFVSQKRNFNNLYFAIQQRKETLLKLGKVLGKKQRKYLSSMNEEDLVSVKLDEVAKELNLATSTISRAVKDKYVECQGKIFSLKLLFPRKSVNNVTQMQLEGMLQELIEKENKSTPLSDDQLVISFKERNIQISRRTISKYRQRLGIKNSYQRKE
ncbi:MAG: RNA polymerase factor sigma-54 [Lactobacillus sp.]|uniref:RNA polymerase factor sigma-54 n=1 Tax=Lactobacillus sp. TaxID=1591 RepID=UPI0023CD9370|nr:RNA polymerase factor sigma-54 [Lactobacillus sp.]MDE7050162.1 RNA polymerase factor sigma-54 [Lactobacillus sp.]